MIRQIKAFLVLGGMGALLAWEVGSEILKHLH
jgi:hypothetical protein